MKRFGNVVAASVLLIAGVALGDEPRAYEKVVKDGDVTEVEIWLPAQPVVQPPVPAPPPPAAEKPTPGRWLLSHLSFGGYAIGSDYGYGFGAQARLRVPIIDEDKLFLVGTTGLGWANSATEGSGFGWHVAVGAGHGFTSWFEGELMAICDGDSGDFHGVRTFTCGLGPAFTFVVGGHLELTVAGALGVGERHDHYEAGKFVPQEPMLGYLGTASAAYRF